MRRILEPLTRVTDSPWYRAVVGLVFVILLGNLIWLIAHGFRPATVADEARLAAVAQSFAPPGARVKIVKSFHKGDYPLAEVDVEYYDVDISAADLKRFYDKSFADNGWKQCSYGGSLFGTFSKAYAKAYDSAALTIPQAGTVFSYEVNFSWEIPSSC